MLVRVKLPRNRAWHYRIDRTIGPVAPCFREAQGEDKDITFFHDLAHSGIEGLAGGAQGRFAFKTVGFNGRAVGVVEPPILPLPDLILRLAQLIGLLQHLEQLQGGVDIAVAGGIDPIIVQLACLGVQRRVVLGDEILKTRFL